VCGSVQSGATRQNGSQSRGTGPRRRQTALQFYLRREVPRRCASRPHTSARTCPWPRRGTATVAVRRPASALWAGAQPQSRFRDMVSWHVACAQFTRCNEHTGVQRHALGSVWIGQNGPPCDSAMKERAWQATAIEESQQVSDRNLGSYKSEENRNGVGKLSVVASTAEASRRQKGRTSREAVSKRRSSKMRSSKIEIQQDEHVLPACAFVSFCTLSSRPPSSRPQAAVPSTWRACRQLRPLRRHQRRRQRRAGRRSCPRSSRPYA